MDICTRPRGDDSSERAISPSACKTRLARSLMIWQLLQVKHLEHTPLILVARMWPGLITWAREAMLDGDTQLASPDDIAIPRCVANAEEALRGVETGNGMMSQQRSR